MKCKSCLLLITFLWLLAGSIHFAEARIQIVDMNDFNFGTWSGSGNLTATDQVCVWEDSGNNRYRVTATGTGAGGAFTITGGTTALPYQVTWTSSNGTTQTLTANVQSVQFRASSFVNRCGGGTNATLRIDIQQSDLLASEAATYTGTLTLLLVRN